MQVFRRMLATMSKSFACCDVEQFRIPAIVMQKLQIQKFLGWGAGLVRFLSCRFTDSLQIEIRFFYFFFIFYFLNVRQL